MAAFQKRMNKALLKKAYNACLDVYWESADAEAVKTACPVEIRKDSSKLYDHIVKVEMGKSVTGAPKRFQSGGALEGWPKKLASWLKKEGWENIPEVYYFFSLLRAFAMSDAKELREELLSNLVQVEGLLTHAHRDFKKPGWGRVSQVRTMSQQRETNFVQKYLTNTAWGTQRRQHPERR